MIECLIAFFKLNKSGTLKSLIPLILDGNSPMAFKVVLIKSCYAIVNEVKKKISNLFFC